jgi:hypothetical protein
VKRRWPYGAALVASTVRLWAADPGPSQPPDAANPPYHGGALDHPFPDNVYGADHDGSTLTLSNPFTSRFGRTDHSRGVVTYACAPFTPRGSEGIYGLDVWLEQQNPDGSWSPIAMNGGRPDGAGSPYQPVNTPNPGPSPAYRFQWTFDATPLPKFAALRVFIYVYLYNQGGGSQGNFYVPSVLGTLQTGAAADAPVVVWDPSAGPVNPAQATAGSTYTISATAQSDNGDLTSITIWQNGASFASAGGGDGWTSNAQQSAPAAAGTTTTYTAAATDATGLESSFISWTVTVAALQAQAAVSAANVILTLGETFTPAFSGGGGTGVWQYSIAGWTNWDGAASGNSGTENPNGTWSIAWTPTVATTYQYWIAHGGDATYLPTQPTGPFTITVVAPTPPAPTPPAPPSTPPPSTPTPAPTPPPSTPPSPPAPTPPSVPSPAPSSPPAPPSSPTPPAAIVRIRFNAHGEEASLHSPGGHSATPLWTDPDSLATSPWPSFTGGVPITALHFPFPLPTVPTAQPVP